MSRRVKHSQALLIGKIVKTCILAAIGIVMVAPVVWMVSTSFKVEARYSIFRYSGFRKTRHFPIT